jgi:hypothetical protein
MRGMTFSHDRMVAVPGSGRTRVLTQKLAAHSGDCQQKERYLCLQGAALLNGLIAALYAYARQWMPADAVPGLIGGCQQDVRNGKADQHSSVAVAALAAKTS